MHGIAFGRRDALDEEIAPADAPACAQNYVLERILC